jgi:hypothetical protein
MPDTCTAEPTRKRIMDSLKNRIERLTVEQQREVEDFIDFLLLKNNARQGPSTALPPAWMNAPPVMDAEPGPAIPGIYLSPQGNESRKPGIPQELLPDPPIHETPSASDNGITRDYLDYGEYDADWPVSAGSEKKVRPRISRQRTGDESSHQLDWVD